MSKKKLYVLAAVFAVFMILVGISECSRKNRGSLIEEAGIVSLAPEGFLTSDVTWMEIWRNGKENEKIALKQTENGWIIESRFNAPADTEKVKNVLNMYKDLLGEFRSDNAEILGDYGLTDNAIHMKIVRGGADQEPAEIVIGRESKFACKQGEAIAYSISTDFNKEFGIWGDSTDAPAAKEWLDKDLLELEKDKLASIELQYPDKKLKYIRREKTVPEPDTEEGEEAEPEPKAAEFEWVLKSEVPAGFEAKANAADRILQKLENLQCDDIADPALKAQWGLDQPAFKLQIQPEEGEPIVIKAGYPEPDGDAYIQVSTAGDHVYTIRSWVFTNLFPKARDQFTNLKESDIAADTIASVTVQTVTGDRYMIDNRGDKPLLVSPQVALPQQDDIVKKVIDGLSQIRFDDAAWETDIETGLVEPAGMITVKLKDGGQRQIAIGHSSPLIKGAYVQLDDGGPVLVASQASLDKVLPGLDTLYTKELLSITPDSIAGLTIMTGNQTIVLKRGDTGWTGMENGMVFIVNADAVNNYTKYINPLNVNGVSMKEGEKLLTTVLIEDTEGTITRLFLSRIGETDFTLTIDGRAGIFLIDDMKYNQLAATFVKFKNEQAVE